MYIHPCTSAEIHEGYCGAPPGAGESQADTHQGWGDGGHLPTGSHWDQTYNRGSQGGSWRGDDTTNSSRYNRPGGSNPREYNKEIPHQQTDIIQQWAKSHLRAACMVPLRGTCRVSNSHEPMAETFFGYSDREQVGLRNFFSSLGRTASATGTSKKIPHNSPTKPEHPPTSQIVRL